MSTEQEPNGEQAALWNGPAGQAWVASQATMDQMLRPFEQRLLQCVAAQQPAEAPWRVLDLGCGTGSTTLAVARQIRPRGVCTGLDISTPMIDAARTRAAQEALPAGFICADAQTHPFEAGSFDQAISRFGVMFFDDPVQAFTRLRTALRPGGTLHFVAWRSAAENAFMTTAERTAATLLPGLPPRRPGAPGQFAFADAPRVAAILGEAGWADVQITPIEDRCTVPAAALHDYVMRMGPVGQHLQTVDTALRERVAAELRQAFTPYVRGNDAMFTAACWMVEARAPYKDAKLTATSAGAA